MRVLIEDISKEEVPEPITTMYKQDVLIQVLAANGCGDNLYMNGDRLLCGNDCENCKFSQILLETDFHKGRIAERTLQLYDVDVETYKLYAPEHQPPATKRLPYRKIA